MLTEHLGILKVWNPTVVPPVWSLDFECYIFFFFLRIYFFVCLSGNDQASPSKLVILRITEGNVHMHEPLRVAVNPGDIRSPTTLCFLNLWAEGTVGSFSTCMTSAIWLGSWKQEPVPQITPVCKCNDSVFHLSVCPSECHVKGVWWLVMEECWRIRRWEQKSTPMM